MIWGRVAAGIVTKAPGRQDSHQESKGVAHWDMHGNDHQRYILRIITGRQRNPVKRV